MRLLPAPLLLLALVLVDCGGVDSGPDIIRPDTKADCEGRGGEWVETAGGYCIETA